MAYGNPFQKFIYQISPPPVRNFMTSIYSRRRGEVKFGPKFYEYLSDLERTQWYSASELEHLQNEKLRSLVHYTIKFIPHYSNLFSNLSLTAQDLGCAEDLRKIPVLEKKSVQNNHSSFLSSLYKNPKLFEIFKTSGTTGKALDVHVTKECLQLEKAFTFLHRKWGGIELGDRTAAFVGIPVVPIKQKTPPFWVYDKAENRMFYSLQHLSSQYLPSFADSLANYHPKMIYGYPTAIYIMAAYLNSSGINSIRPKAVFTASESLLPHHRTEIERAFGCKVFDWYGATEPVANIVECERGNYHIKEEYGIVEILKQDGTHANPGEVGDLICTGLNNFAMPFIRYRVGDTAIPKAGSCPCGRGGRLIERIVGRLEDVIVTPDNRLLSRLDFVLKGMNNVEEAQLIQETKNQLRVRLVKRANYSDIDERKLKANILERTGPEMQITFEYMDLIPRTANGKFRYVISKVPLEIADIRQTGEVLGLYTEEDKTL